MTQSYRLTINGVARSLESPAERSLLDVLREDCGLTGCKIGCGEGECGACSVLMDGALTRACITPIGNVAGHAVRTVEGLSDGEALHPLQQAFADLDALQCGYCTPGMIVAGVALLEQNPSPSVEEIVRFMNGNICRCGSYPRIVRAIQQAAIALKPTGTSV